MNLYHSHIGNRSQPGSMAIMVEAPTLQRFVEAQAGAYAGALAEIRRGSKHAHWMWFIFPQIAGLGRSATARFYGIRSAEEACAYLEHRVLGPRYFECVEALQDLTLSNPVAVFGDIDAIKLRSSLTLFEAVAPHPLFTAALNRWFRGERDPMTLALLAEDHARPGADRDAPGGGTHIRS